MSNPNADRVRQRLAHEQQEAEARARAARTEAGRRDEELKARIVATGRQIVAELNRLDWPGAILQGSEVIYPVGHDTGVNMEAELYLLPYQGDGEYSSTWVRVTSLGGFNLEFLLGTMESALGDLRSR